MHTPTPTPTQFKVSLFFFLSKEFIESRVKGREDRKKCREEEEEGPACLFRRATGRVKVNLRDSKRFILESLERVELSFYGVTEIVRSKYPEVFRFSAFEVN